MQQEVQLRVGKAEAPLLVTYYTNQLNLIYSEIDELKERLEDLEDKKSSYEAALSELSKITDVSDSNDATEKYNPKWSYFLKAKHILSISNKAISLQEIAHEIHKREPNRIFLDITNNLSAIFSMDSKKPNPVFTRSKKDGGKYEYSLT